MQVLQEHEVDVMLLDLGLPDESGLDLLKNVRKLYPNIPVIVVTANDSINNAIESTKIGSFHFIPKPYVPEELLNLVAKAVEQRGMKEETQRLREETERQKRKVQKLEAQLQPVFKNARMRELFALVEQIAHSDANVLIVGDSGVGKEVFANRIHELSSRAAREMVKLNCAALPANMIEGELFGYKKGAFTGASQDFPGMLSAASGSTLFLDEISEMPVDLQTRFLRVLQEREYRPLGSVQTYKTDFRLISASNRRPEEAIRQGRLREDLYYRLNTFTLWVPPLRERPEDIAELAQLFLERYCARMHKPMLTIQSETFEVLMRCEWRGNVRELQNAIEHAVVLAKGSLITPQHLPEQIRTNYAARDKAMTSTSSQLSPVKKQLQLTDSQTLNLAEREKASIVEALEQCNGNKKQAAKLLGIHRPTLYTKMKKFGLDSPGKEEKEEGEIDETGENIEREDE